MLVGCVDEDPDTTGDEDVTDVSDTVDAAPRADADPGSTTDADATPSVDATTDAASDADHDASTDSGETCTMGEYLRYNGCPCDTNLQQCCWGTIHMECSVPPGQLLGTWGEVHDANWNCDEYLDCEDFEGVPGP